MVADLGWVDFQAPPIGVIHICLYGCLCVHETAATLDGVAELPGTQTSQQTDVNECHSLSTYVPRD